MHLVLLCKLHVICINSCGYTLYSSQNCTLYSTVCVAWLYKLCNKKLHWLCQQRHYLAMRLWTVSLDLTHTEANFSRNLIRYAYKSLRFLHLEIWRFCTNNDDKTDYFTPCACTQGSYGQDYSTLSNNFIQLNGR